MRLTWDSLNLLFFQKFTEHLVRIKELNNTTLEKTLQRLRAFLRHCDEVQGIPMCRDYQRFTRKALPKGEQSRKVYITWAELRSIQALDLAVNEKLAKVRDVFLFLAHTGLRYGDCKLLRPEHFKGDTLHLTTGKNRKTICIPVHRTARRIWKQYKEQLPTISNQKFNDYLKDICEKAKIDEACIVVDFAGAERREKTLPK